VSTDSAVMAEGWQPDGAGVQPEPEPFFDTSMAGSAFRVRYVHAGLPRAAVTCTAYPARDGARLLVRVATRFSGRAAPGRPRGLDEWAHTDYRDEPGTYPDTAAAETAARQAAARLLGEAGSVTWDGQPHGLDR